MESANRIMSLQCKIWWQSFLDDPVYGYYKLKRLKGSLSAFYEPRLSVVPEVDLVEFRAIEKDRLPLYIGSQFGTFPRTKDAFNDGKERIVVILSFSMLSGVMGSLSIYQYKGPNAISKLHSIEFPHHLLKAEILNIDCIQKGSDRSDLAAKTSKSMISPD